MKRAIQAGALYFALMFALGFVLGIGRVSWLVPRLGPVTAALIETPIMLAVSWFACVALLRRFSVRVATSHRLAMGALAFVLLIGAETLLGLYGFGRSWVEQQAAFVAPSGLVGLTAQLLFASFPLLAHRERVIGRA